MLPLYIVHSERPVNGVIGDGQGLVSFRMCLLVGQLLVDFRLVELDNDITKCRS